MARKMFVLVAALLTVAGGAAVQLPCDSDPLGRLATARLPGETVSYAYNVRNALTSISSPRFSQQLRYAAGAANPCYNGNIAEAVTQGNRYAYTYDNANRLTAAKYTDAGAGPRYVPNYSASYAYDRNSNITALTRYGQTGINTWGKIDDLTMTYDGNQLSKVEDAADEVLLETSRDIKPIDPGIGDFIGLPQFSYDTNGNTVRDITRNLYSVTYNALNLPQSATISSETVKFVMPSDASRIDYTYDGAGVKHQTVHTTVTKTTLGNKVFTRTKRDTTRYVGSRIYENGRLDRVLTPYGYIKEGVHHTFLHDYQGNVAAVVAGDSLVQRTTYYPYGLPHANAHGATANPYKYSGKEFDTFGGTDLYDFHARHHAPSTGRFMTVDPMAEKYPGISPYMYCAGNPIIFIDTDGQELKLVGTQEDINRTIFHYQTGLGSAYNIQINSNGFILINANSAVSSCAIPQTNREYYNILNRVISDKQTTTLNVQKNVPEIIGDIKTGSVDVNDLDKLGDGEFINASSALLHETYEQYQIQTKNTHPTKAHLNAAGAEERVTGTFPSPLQREANIETRQMVIPILNGVEHDTQVGTVTILFDENNNITNVKRTKITHQNNDE